MALPSGLPERSEKHPLSWQVAVRAAESKKASDLRVLDLQEVTAFADFFVLCTGSNPPQIQAICDEIRRQMRDIGEFPTSIEGYAHADWILVDYGDCVIHIFSQKARDYYDLDRLWRHAKELPVPVSGA
ncbi:MAG: ribosome silencing factor [Bryobacteraceae bacterium]